MLEIQDHAGFAAGNPQVIDHLADMFVRDGLDRLDLHDDPPFDLQIGDVVIDVLPAIMNGMRMLGIIGNVLPLEFQAQSPFICLFPQSVSQFIQDRHGAAGDFVHQTALNPFPGIRVHSRPFAVVSFRPIQSWIRKFLNCQGSFRSRLALA